MKHRLTILRFYGKINTFQNKRNILTEITQVRMVIDDQNLSGSETIEQEAVDKNVVGKTI